MDHVTCVVAGAGVVGLAIARAFALAGHDVLVLDPAEAIGTETSSRNSEVIHAGLHYAEGSLKARLCIEGKQRLYAFLQERSVPYRRCEKLIVATEPGQAVRLGRIADHAAACGVDDLVLLDGAQACRMEPALRAEAALLSPSTGIVDSHLYMLALQADIESAGGAVVLGTEVERVDRTSGAFHLATRDRASDLTFDLSATFFVNAAGLGAERLARAIAMLPPERVPRLVFAKGNYFSARGRSPFSRLIYPVPVDGGLGVHLTFDLAGQMRFGPDVQWIDEIDYTVDPRRSEAFYEEIRRYWPALPDDTLSPAYCGIRPKLSGPGGPAADFAIEGEETHGVERLIALYGIESPGLTASLAIAEEVLRRATR